MRFVLDGLIGPEGGEAKDDFGDDDVEGDVANHGDVLGVPDEGQANFCSCEDEERCEDHNSVSNGFGMAFGKA